MSDDKEEPSGKLGGGDFDRKREAHKVMNHSECGNR